MRRDEKTTHLVLPKKFITLLQPTEVAIFVG